MTDLEEWTLSCIIAVFGTLLSFAIILCRDQMIIQESFFQAQAHLHPQL